MPVKILTKGDLMPFRIKLLQDIKERLNSQQTSENWIRSSDVRLKLKISAHCWHGHALGICPRQSARLHLPLAYCSNICFMIGARMGINREVDDSDEVDDTLDTDTLDYETDETDYYEEP